jgi:phage-related protein
MPIPVPYPAVAPTEYVPGDLPALTLSRDTVTLPLTLANGWAILPGVEGLDDPPRAIIEVEPATWDGSLFTGARYAAREVFLPLNYATSDTATLRAITRSLAALLDVKRGPVTLEVAHLDGTRRYIEGYPSTPFGSPLTSREATRWRQFGITLRCMDPFWYAAEQTLTFQLGGEPAEFLGDEFLPMQVNESQVLGDLTVTNPGDADAYPVWTLTGPCDDAEVSIGDTLWAVPEGLTDSEVLIVDARRGQQTVTVNGSPAWDYLGPGAQLGALAPGDNSLDVTVTGATAATVLTVEWRERWLTAW